MTSSALQYVSSSQAISKLINREPDILIGIYYDALQLANVSLARLSVYSRGNHFLEQQKSKRAAVLITTWLNDPTDLDEDVYPKLEQELKSGTMRCREG